MHKDARKNARGQGSLPEERRVAILGHLAVAGRVVCSELAREWNISEDTVRRDIRDLDDAGLLRRVHGGALPRNARPVPYGDRVQADIAMKQRIAARAALAVVDGMTALFYGGTTTLAATRLLPSGIRARIITNDPRIALEASGRERLETILLGGRVHPGMQLVLGSQAVDAVRALHADVCLVGACALHDEFGLGVEDVEEAVLQQAFIAAASSVVALVTPEKLQTVAPFRVTSATAVARIITSANADDDVLARYRTVGIVVDAV